MDDRLADLAVLAVFFVGSHFILSHPPVRKFLIHRWHTWPFRAFYSVISIILFIQMLVAYGAAPDAALFAPALTMAPLIAMAPATILILCGYTIVNPSAVGLEDLGKARDIPGILKITRQPVMWGIGLFSLSHMAARPVAAAWIFFGALAVLALVGGYHLDRRKLAEDDKDWTALAAQSSFVPFAAILGGRARVTPGQVGWWRLLGGMTLFAGLLAAHTAVIGVSPLPSDFML